MKKYNEILKESADRIINNFMLHEGVMDDVKVHAKNAKSSFDRLPFEHKIYTAAIALPALGYTIKLALKAASRAKAKICIKGCYKDPMHNKSAHALENCVKYKCGVGAIVSKN